MTIEKNKSFFMMDSSEGNANKEAIMDFVVSWTLRMAVDHKKIKRPILHKCSRNLLFKLIGKQNFKKTRVVKVEKQNPPPRDNCAYTLTGATCHDGRRK